MQPAARQQRIVFGLREALSFSAISIRSSMTMVDPSFHMFEGRRGSLARRDRAVIDDSRSDAAGANAPGGQQRELIIRSRFAGFDASLLLHRSEDFIPAFDITCRAHANDTRVLALWFEGEEVVEGGHAIDAAGRQLEVISHKEQQIVFQ